MKITETKDLTIGTNVFGTFDYTELLEFEVIEPEKSKYGTNIPGDSLLRPIGSKCVRHITCGVYKVWSTKEEVLRAICDNCYAESIKIKKKVQYFNRKNLRNEKILRKAMNRLEQIDHEK